MGRVIAVECWPHLQGLEWDDHKHFYGYPLFTSSSPRVSSWCGLPGESLSPTEHAIKLGGVCWFVTSCGSPLSFSGTCTPRCFNLFLELWVHSPVHCVIYGWWFWLFSCDQLVEREIILCLFLSYYYERRSPHITFRAFKSWKMPWQSGDSEITFPGFGYFQVSFNSSHNFLPTFVSNLQSELVYT